MGRMDRYQNDGAQSRLDKNKKLYDNVSDIDIDYIDINYDNSVEIDPNKKMSKSKREDYQTIKQFNGYVPIKKNEEVYEEKTTKKIYDIDTILKKARENNLFDEDKKKRLINTEYNILSKLDLDTIEKENLSKEDLHSLIDKIYEKEGKSDLNTKLKRIDKNNSSYDLLHDLIDDKTDTDLVVNTEIAKEILDKSEDTITYTGEKKDSKKNNKKNNVIENNNIDEENIGKDKVEEKDEIDDFIEKEKKSVPVVTDRILKNIEDTDVINHLESKSKRLLVVMIIIVIILLVVSGYLLYKYFAA